MKFATSGKFHFITIVMIKKYGIIKNEKKYMAISYKLYYLKLVNE